MVMVANAGHPRRHARREGVRDDGRQGGPADRRHAGRPAELRRPRGQGRRPDVYADQQVVAQVFRTPTDQAAALSLDKTERGVRINVDFASGALGAIKAGDHVDYFATFAVKPPGDTAGNLFFTRRLMTDVRVLEAPVPDVESGPGKLSEEDKDTKQQTLMVAVTQADATKIAFIEALKKGDGAAVVSWVAVRPPEGQAVRDADHGREPEVHARGRRPAQRAEDEVLAATSPSSSRPRSTPRTTPTTQRRPPASTRPTPTRPAVAARAAAARAATRPPSSSPPPTPTP